MQSRSYILIALATLVLGSCGVPKNKFRLNGKFKNIRSADIFIYSEERYDTLHIRDGKFSYERELDEPEILTIQYPDFSQRKIIAEPGQKVNFTTDAADLTKTRVKGTEENELLSQFYDDVSGKHGEQVKNIAADFANKNAKTLAAQAVLESYLLAVKNVDGPLTKRLLSRMLKLQPHNAQLSSLAGKTMPMLATMPGAKAPDFKVKAYNGTDISLATFKGKYLLVSFWASWQYDSFQQIRGLKGLIKPFRSQMGLINVCLDYDIRSFRNTLSRDTLPEYNICDQLAWKTPLVRLFGVSYVPGNVLISPDGKILARDIKASELKARLGKFIKP